MNTNTHMDPLLIASDLLMDYNEIIQFLKSYLFTIQMNS